VNVIAPSSSEFVPAEGVIQPSSSALQNLATSWVVPSIVRPAAAQLETRSYSLKIEDSELWRRLHLRTLY
jgi:hypothetical protein